MGSGAMDIQDMVQYVLEETYRDVSQDLWEYSEKFKNMVHYYLNVSSV